MTRFSPNPAPETLIPASYSESAVDALSHMRSTVLVTDQIGTILQAHGGAGRPLGYAPEELVGRNGIEFVAVEDQQIMAEIAIGAGDAPVVSTPAPFPLRMIGPDGTIHTWDCAPTGYSENGQDGWVLMMTCRKDQSAAIEAMECFIAGGSALEIAAVIARRHQSTPNQEWRKSALVLYRQPQESPGMPTGWQMLTPAIGTDPRLSDALTRCLADPTAAWNTIAPGTSVASFELPQRLENAAASVGMSSCTALGVGIDGNSQIVFLRFSNFDHGLQSNSKLADQAVESVLRRALIGEHSSEMLHLAVRSDPITGIANRLSFDEAIEATNDVSNPAILFIDIDRFKAVNDTYGHAAGDATLREVADRIVRACRPEDMVARVGGDEFAVILHHVTAAEAHRVANRIRGSMGQPLPPGTGPRLVSVTVGIAVPDPGASLSTLVRLADKEMLNNKGPDGRRPATDDRSSADAVATVDIRTDILHAGSS